VCCAQLPNPLDQTPSATSVVECTRSMVQQSVDAVQSMTRLREALHEGVGPFPEFRSHPNLASSRWTCSKTASLFSLFLQ
jgi:hypothetical protein